MPSLKAVRLSRSYGRPVVDITIKKMNGKTLEFTLSDIVLIYAFMLNDVDTNLPKFGYTDEGYFEGHALFIIFYGLTQTYIFGKP